MNTYMVEVEIDNTTTRMQVTAENEEAAKRFAESWAKRVAGDMLDRGDTKIHHRMGAGARRSPLKRA